jgi:hypothetical protein
VQIISANYSLDIRAGANRAESGKVGNFTDFTITEDLTGDYGCLQQILIKIEQVK